MVEPSSGLQRSRPASMTVERADTEKRRRSRVTPEQLVHLERFFAMDRSPTAARRKEIGDMLGMRERQTQIWFQNRRAKAKLQDGKKRRSSSAETPPDTPPELATGYEVELQNLLHEDEPVTIIHCTDLSVGTWRRVATALRKYDLVVYLCEPKRYLAWFIRSSGYGFKMEIPFDIIVDTEFTNAAPGLGLASFILSQPPTFYLDSFSPFHPAQGIEPVRHWQKCADWTEGQQATKVLRHNLVGPVVQLAHVLRHLNARMSELDVRLRSPGYHSGSQEPSPSIPDRPVAFARTRYYYPQDSMEPCQQDRQLLTQERSFSPATSQQLSIPDEPMHPSVARPSARVVPEPDLPIHLQYPRHPVSEARQPTLHSDTLPYHTSHSSFIANHEPSQSFSSHSSHRRPYSAGSVHSLPYEHNNRILSFPDNFQSAGSTSPTPLGTPPLLTTPFYLAGSPTDIRTPNCRGPVIPFISGMSDSVANS